MLGDISRDGYADAWTEGRKLRRRRVTVLCRTRRDVDLRYRNTTFHQFDTNAVPRICRITVAPFLTKAEAIWEH